MLLLLCCQPGLCFGPAGGFDWQLEHYDTPVTLRLRCCFRQHPVELLLQQLAPLLQELLQLC